MLRDGQASQDNNLVSWILTFDMSNKQSYLKQASGYPYLARIKVKQAKAVEP